MSNVYTFKDMIKLLLTAKPDRTGPTVDGNGYSRQPVYPCHVVLLYFNSVLHCREICEFIDTVHKKVMVIIVYEFYALYNWYASLYVCE